MCISFNNELDFDQMTQDIKQVRETASQIHGWLADAEGLLLFRLAKLCREGCIVEIGSWHGKSTIWLASGSYYGFQVPVYSVDPHHGSPEHRAHLLGDEIDTYPIFTRNIAAAGLDDIVKPLCMTSEEAAYDFPHPVSLLFIDGAHEERMVYLDYISWFQKLVPHGVIAFHDSFKNWPGVTSVIRKHIYINSEVKDLARYNTITYGRKSVKRSRFREWGGKLFFIACNEAEFAYRRINKRVPGFIKRVIKKAGRSIG